MEKILLVDDEQSVLDALQRQLRNKYQIETAISGQKGLKKIADNGPFAVIISDMRMPAMDGIAFLMQVRQVAPESVRMMLTGNADQQTAIEAINRGSIFRFLNKPCSQGNLADAINAGLEQYRLITAEKELLEKTLKGSINILMDILSLTYPIGFSQSMRLRKYAVQIAQKMQLFGAWQYELAAMLSSIGFINVPTECIEKHMAGGILSKEEKEMIDSIPETAGMLLKNIPRLSVVASMITQREVIHTGTIDFTSREHSEMIRIGAKMLKVITDFDILLFQNHEPEDSINILASQGSLYDSNILDVLTIVDLPRRGRVSRYLKINELQKGMVIDTDIYNAQGILIVPRGYEVNETTAERLKNFLLKKASLTSSGGASDNLSQGGKDGEERPDTIRVLMSVFNE